MSTTAEGTRLAENKSRQKNWQRWGTYLPERQWGTVREDYSADGDVWNSFTHEQAQFRAYRWGEDGLLGWTDRQCRLCFSLALWNGKDDRLKERLFGLGNTEGNHGEDVKELFYYLDAVPTHSYAKALYKYPHAAFPYEQLRSENKKRGFDQREFELLDTGVFNDDRYFDVQIEYAKADVEDTLIRISLTNRGPEKAKLHVLPTLVLRNNWAWQNLEANGKTKPGLRQVAPLQVEADHKVLGRFAFTVLRDAPAQPSRLLFTENDTNQQRMNPNTAPKPEGVPAPSAPFPGKDAFNHFLVHGEQNAVRPDGQGTKCAFLFAEDLEAGASEVLYLRLARIDQSPPPTLSLDQAIAVFQQRQREADAFYASVIPQQATAEEKAVSRQAYAGLLWCKQFYYFVANAWLKGDETQPAPQRESKANESWTHLFCRDVLSVPDKWEYPWFAAWDLAFHMIPMTAIDPEFAKGQLLLLLREWYMHPNGQMPAYEFAFGDVNPPVHAWAVWHVYRLGVDAEGKGDLDFLERAFQKMLLNFTWWVNRNDEQGRNLFGGGFLGLDNIGVFDRSTQMPDGTSLHQADGTAWMGLYCSCMMQIALELAHQRSRPYEDIASKFFEHYVAVIHAINTVDGQGLWDDEQGFYFDHLVSGSSAPAPMKVRSMVGIVPLFALGVLKRDTVAGLDEFEKRTRWFLAHEKELAQYVQRSEHGNDEIEGSLWISIAPKDRFERILRRVLDQSEFLSDYGVRALSKCHAKDPFTTELSGQRFEVQYVPAEGDSGLFGGNSNWRGPVWFPVNFLIISALERYYLVLGDEFRMEYPTGSGERKTLVEIREALTRRLVNLFLFDRNGNRPCHGGEPRYASSGPWKDLLLFNEYFSGDDGRGLGASHQTGWTALVATMIRILYTPRQLGNRAQ